MKSHITTGCQCATWLEEGEQEACAAGRVLSEALQDRESLSLKVSETQPYSSHTELHYQGPFEVGGACMPSAYIYMEHPATGEPLMLGRLTLQHNKPGEFTYSPTAIEGNVWVPDPIHYPLTEQTYIVTKNQGIPGFINDAIPDGWGEHLLQRMQHDPVSRFDLLIHSPNNDRAGNLMTGLDPQPLLGTGQEPLPGLAGLEAFIDACDVIYDPTIDEDRLKKFGLSSQISSLGGARPKRTFVSEHSLLLAKPADRFDQYHVAPLEHACMSFAANKGMRVAKTALHNDQKGSTLLR